MAGAVGRSPTVQGEQLGLQCLAQGRMGHDLSVLDLNPQPSNHKHSSYVAAPFFCLFINVLF